MPHRFLPLTTLLAVAALALPATALAQDPAPPPTPVPPTVPGGPDSARCKAQNAKSKRLPRFVFKGVYVGSSAIRVTSGSRLVRRGGFLRKRVTFDASCVVIRTGDGNGDGFGYQAEDLKRGDVVTFEARLSARTRYRPGRVLKATKATNNSNKPTTAPAAPTPTPTPTI